MSRTATPRGRRLAAPLALAATAAGLLALLALTPAGPRAEAAAPQVAAAHQTTERVTVHLKLPAVAIIRNDILVELLGDDDKVIQSKKIAWLDNGDAEAKVEFAALKVAADKVRVRTSHAGKSETKALTAVLLVKAHETTLAAPGELQAGAQAEMRCVVQGVRSLGESVPLKADVEVRFIGPEKKVISLYKGKTGADGVAPVRFTVPDVPPGTYTVQVETRSHLGSEKLERAVNVAGGVKVLLTADKPLYQPGQTIHIRALALRAHDLHARAGADLTLEVEDGKGNKVFKKELKTSAFGIASADFTLADEVNMGEYRLRATLGDHRAEKAVTVKRYVLPKFKTELKSDKTFYLPKETVKATLQVDYFFGKPVAGAAVVVKASTFDVAFKDFATWKGKTDKNGHATFEVTLPASFVGTPLANGNALVKLEATVTDTADHAEAVTRTYPVSDRSIRVALLPEGGRMVPDIENRVFVAAQYPDGSPAACAVDVWVGREGKGPALARLKTNDAGLAEIKLTPRAGQFRAGAWEQQNVEMLGGTQQRWGQKNLFDLTAEARDARGNKARSVVELTSEPFGENLLLKLDKAIYKGGDRLTLDVRTTAGMPTVYVDIVKSRQTMLTRWLGVKDGRATTAIDLPASVFGTLEVHAYQVLVTGEVIRDTRVVYVNQAGELKVSVTADKGTYRPGEEGVVRFEVTDKQGNPTAAALGVLIVDEAVYALQEMQPGLEKVFFTLQGELLKPRGQVVFNPREGLDGMIQRPAVGAPQQQIAQALLTAARPKPPAAWRVDPAGERKRALMTRVQQVATGLFHYAMQQTTVLEKDKAGKYGFPKDLLAKVLKSGHVTKPWLADGMGGELTLESLAKAMPDFTAERFARAQTEARLASLYWPIHWVTQQNRAAWHKNNKWELPADIVARAAKSADYGVVSAKDAWGREIKLVKRANKDVPAVFEELTLVSAGPDGKFGTKDDITYRALDSWRMSYLWYQPVASRRLADADWRFRGKAGEQMFFGFRGGMGGPAPGAVPRGAVADGAGTGKGQAEQKRSTGEGGAAGGPAPPKLREYFPETLLWQPSLITDERGRATLKVPFADSITTWRLTASASSKGGLLGATTAPLRVFQDFFVDLDLPVALTQNDEVAFPVAVYNYLKSPQTVTLTLKKEPWFALADEGGLTRTVKLQANEVTSVKFRIKAAKVGHFPLQVDAKGTKLSDATRRTIEVLPDGQGVEQIFTDRLKGTVRHPVTIPDHAIDGASRLFVKVYPGIHSQLLEGTEAMLGMPHGCFEQTSSTAYPNVLVVDYLKKSKQGSPATLLKAETYLAAGYQRLLTFERPGGGFDWWGRGEPLVWLSAYGLQQFNDMAKVWPIDKGVIDRTQKFLFSKQAADGTWGDIGATHGVSIESMGDKKLLLTSYVAWSILDSMPRPAGWQKTEDYKKLKKAIEYVRDQAPKADNAYVLALAANALASWDAKDDSTHAVLTKLLKQLDKMQEARRDWDAICYPAKGQSMAYGRGEFLTVETTALAVMAMVKSGEFTNSVNKAMTYLIKSKQGGHWGSTQATILALKAMVAGLGGSAQKGTTPFTVHVNGKQVAKGEVTEKNADVLQQFDLREHLKSGANEVSLEVKGDTSLMYQVLGRHFVPHDKAAKPKDPILEVDVAYDRTKLTTADVLRAKATVKYHGKVGTYQVIVDLPIPPGFTADGGDFAELVAAKKVERFSVTARQVTLYLGAVKPGSTHEFSYSLKPKYPIKAKTPAAVVYEYYTPSNRAVAKGVTVEVSEKK